ncbi:phosphatase PAP2 family protein [Cryobacterium sp. TMT2-15-1]|uniref:phosphatase PAP2 family protein n=1 Tax=Cryobacterium sp. TMT2-15-1 TaxID=1259246 RepID=UPI00157FAD31|nr:phosphatase PAP2 family protein [Cryobacterium sp. TMT2-15-1]
MSRGVNPGAGAQRVTHWWPLLSGLVAVALAVGLGLVISRNGKPFALDTEWMIAVSGNRAPVWDSLALVMNSLGGGLTGSVVAPGLLIGLLLFLKRPRAAGFALAVTVISGAAVHLLKWLFGRARPAELEDLLVRVDFGSFPSGHVANAATLAIILALLFRFCWVWLAGALYTALMMLSRTYLGAHWLTDTVGAALLGIGIAVAVWAPLAVTLDRERRRSRASHPWRTFHDRYVVERWELTDRSRRMLRVTAIACLGSGAVFFTLTLLSVLSGGGVTAIDLPVQEWLLEARSPVLTTVMVVLAVVFGPVALPLIVLVVCVGWGLLTRHAWRALLLAGAMASGVVLAQVIGRTVGRERPPIDLMLFGTDLTFSFPSGHVLGASDFLLVTAYLLLSRRFSMRATAAALSVAVVGIVLAALSRLYLGYHWTTDALASVSISLVVVGCVIAVDTWRTGRVVEPAERG